MAAVRVLADGDVELAVGAEVDGAAVVVGGRAEVREVRGAGPRCPAWRHVRVGGAGGEPADAGCGWARRRSCSRRRRSGWWRSRDRTATPSRPRSPGGVHADRRERIGQQGPVPDHAQAAALLADEEPPVRGEGHGGRAGQVAVQAGLAEAGGGWRRPPRRPWRLAAPGRPGAREGTQTAGKACGGTSVFSGGGPEKRGRHGAPWRDGPGRMCSSVRPPSVQVALGWPEESVPQR